MIVKSVQSKNPWKSPPGGLSRAGVILTSYDIVKAHGGDLIVNSKVGEGSAFMMTLPIFLA